MSLSSGPLTAPLASTRGATEAGSTTRMRYVSRVPGPCSVASVKRTLLNHDSATRLLERRAAAGAAPATVGRPPREQARAQGDRDPQRQRAGANRRPGHDEGVRVPGRACECDTHFELAGARAGAMRAGHQVFRERRTLDERQLAVELSVDLHEPLLVRGVCHQASSRTR